MITIAFDETGKFEALEDNEVVMVAGLAYDDKGDPHEANRECDRIRRFFESVCNAEQAQYPEDLHFNHDNTNEIRQGRVKKAYCRKLGAFLKEGSCNGQRVLSDDNRARAGQYSVFAMVKSKNGKTSFSGQGVDGFIRDESASNLYLHMSEDALSRLLFYSDLFSAEDEVILDAATRSLPVGRRLNTSEYDKKGHVRKQNYYSITNADVFHTSLYREMMASEHKRIRIAGLKARSINYGPNASGTAGMEFLYLADAVCTKLGSNGNNALRYHDTYMKVLMTRMKEIGTAGYAPVFFYDDADTLFTKAWDALETDDLFESVTYLYRATHADSEAAKHYREYWEPVLRNRYAAKANKALMVSAVNGLSAAVRRSNLNVEELRYIFETLETIATGMTLQNPEESAFIGELYLDGITIYNHCGNSKKAKLCGKKAAAYEAYLGIGDYLTYCNRRVVTMCDTLRYEEAEAYALSSYRLSADMCTARKKHREDYRPGLEYAKVCSQLGQCYGFLRDDRAEEYFNEALSHMEKDTANYNITLSYLLHFYADKEDEQNFSRCAKSYFGGHDRPEDQLEYLLREYDRGRDALVDFRFGVFILVKGIYVFRTGQISKGLQDKLSNFESFLRERLSGAENVMKGYPWQIIYKYLALIAVAHGNREAALKYQEYLEVFPLESRLMKGEKKSVILKALAEEKEDTDILAAIGLHCRLAVKAALGQKTNAYKQLCEKTVDVLNAINPDLKKHVTHAEVSLDAIDRVLTYTYR